MKSLVTGATGFLGTALVERLLARGERDLKCLVRPGSNRARLTEAVARFRGANVEFFVGTLSSEAAAAAAVEGCDVVYHLAAAMRGAAADMFLGTVVASRNLLEAMAKAGTPGARPKAVLVSSFSVYGVADLPPGATLDETTPLEPQPTRRDVYAQTKLRQEQLFWQYSRERGVPLVVLRPGVIYGPHGSALSNRIGLRLFGVFFHLGGSNELPLTYVDNCAEAIVVAGRSPEAVGRAFNVVDNDLVSAAEYLRCYKRDVAPLRSISLPYSATMLVSRLVARYHAHSGGQIPAVLTPYKTAASWKGTRFTNAKLAALGWRQIVPSLEGLRRTFEHQRKQHANGGQKRAA
jgi:nucleoside-diphosphate-sugar epimerase